MESLVFNGTIYKWQCSIAEMTGLMDRPRNMGRFLLGSSEQRLLQNFVVYHHYIGMGQN